MREREPGDFEDLHEKGREDEEVVDPGDDPRRELAMRREEGLGRPRCEGEEGDAEEEEETGREGE